MCLAQTNMFLHKQQLRDQNFKEEIIDNHESILSSFGLFTIDEEYDLPSLYWLLSLPKNVWRLIVFAPFLFIIFIIIIIIILSFREA